jgi:hypothetical protein
MLWGGAENLRAIKRTSFNRIKLFSLVSGITREPRSRTLGRRTGAFFFRDLALLAWDQILRAAPFVRDLALLGWDQALRLAPHARRHLVLPARNVVALLALVVLCVGLAQTGPGHSVLSGMGLYQPPASYTELTLAAPDNLPSALPSVGSPVNVAFDIHNVSGAARVYQWSIALAKNGHNASQKASGTVTAPAQGRIAVRRSVAASCTGGRLQVQVRLARPAESVEFWVTCAAASRGSR